MGIVVAQIHKSEHINISSLHLAVLFSIYLILIMKCLVILAIVGMSHALPQYYLADTPEVQAAKNQFAQAYNLAASRSAAPSAVPANVEDPGNYSPPAEPYIHEEIPAVPYVHEEVAAEPYVHIGGKNSAAAPVQQAAPAYNPVQAAGPAYNLNLGFPGYNQPYQPAAPATFTGTCYNWRGEGVPCRKQF